MIVDAEGTVFFTDVHVLSMLAWLFNAGGLGESLARTFFVLHAMPCHAAFSLHKVSAVTGIFKSNHSVSSLLATQMLGRYLRFTIRKILVGDSDVACGFKHVRECPLTAACLACQSVPVKTVPLDFKLFAHCFRYKGALHVSFFGATELKI